LENAERELLEEIGAAEVALDLKGRFRFQDAKNKVWGNLYTVQYDGEIRLQEEEVESLELWTCGKK